MNTKQKRSTRTMQNPSRTLISCLLALALACSLPAVPTAALADVREADVVYGETVESRGLSVAQCPNIDAEYALVMDSEGTVYFERNADEATQIASITKIMTAVVALDAVDEGSISLDDEITVSSEASAIGESSASLYAGDTLTLQAALTALLVPSGNDAAVAIAEAVAGSEEAFVELMNEKAAELGCTDTVYENAHGLDSDGYEGDQHSTASDVALIVKYAMQNETFREIVAAGDTTITVSRDGYDVDIALESTDEFSDIYEYAIGVKTGYTSLAGYSFAAAALKDDVELYAVVIGSSSEDQRFEDAKELCEWVYEHLVDYTLANSEETVEMDGEEVPVVAEVAHSDWTDVTIKATLEDPDAAISVFDLNGNVSQSVEFDEITGDVSAGDKLGTITFKQRNEVVATMDIVACEDVEAPGPLESVGVFFKRLVANFSGAQKVAESEILNETPLIVDKTSDDAGEE